MSHLLRIVANIDNVANSLLVRSYSSMELVKMKSCKFYVQRKRRNCRMEARAGLEYCAEHQYKAQDAMIAEADARIPCPLDPKHTCYASKLESHLQICNARPVEHPPYIEINTNKLPESAPRRPLCQVPAELLSQVIEKINVLYEKVFPDGIPQCAEELHWTVSEEFTSVERTETSLKHLRQVSSLLHLLQQEGLMQGNLSYVEFGAGKGQLSYYVSAARGGDSPVLLVDRAALRYKRDGKLPRAARVRTDLAHLVLERAPAVGPLVGLAKHLCGAATDLALRCMSREQVSGRARGMLVATCCHHRCDLNNYTGRVHLQTLGLTDEHMEVMFSVVSWATCGDGFSREVRRARVAAGHDATVSRQTGDPDTDPRRSLTRDERADVGRRAKCLLEWGRVRELCARGFVARVLRYVPLSVSPENLCIVATKQLHTDLT